MIKTAPSDDASILCFQAVWELDKLARVMPGLAKTVEDEDEQMHFAIRGICGRMVSLTSLLMDCMGSSGPVSKEFSDIIYFSETGGQP